MFGLFVTENDVTGSVTCWSLSSRMQNFKERNQGSRLRRTQILSVRRHIAASLDYLPNQLVLRQSHRDTIERRPSLAS